jgi:antitoxin component HigA of HigAB toxin-antitoxin module
MARDHAILKREIAQPRRAPSLPDFLTYLLDQHGLSRADLVPLLGTPSRVSEVAKLATAPSRLAPLNNGDS